MGEFRVTVEGVGGHGCQREFGDGETVAGCGQQHCPDCAARRFIDELRSIGVQVSAAVLVHWPHQVATVLDDLMTGERRGSFPERDRERERVARETKA